MSAANDADELFWRAYCHVIKNQVGDIDGENAIFYSTKAQRGPPGGGGIHEAYTNTGLFDIGDNLLQADNLFYTPSNQNSYINSLLAYLNYVDLEGNPDDADLQRVKTTSENENAARVKLNTEFSRAFKDWEEELKEGNTDDKFIRWVVNAPVYVVARNAYESASDLARQALIQTYGAQASQITTNQNKINQALNADGGSSRPGLIMPCTSLRPESVREVLNAHNQGSTVSAPRAIFYRPLYLCPGYASTVKSWQGRGGSTAQRQEFKLTLEQGHDVTDDEFGQDSVDGEMSFGFVPCISFGTGGQEGSEEDSLDIDAEPGSIEVVMFYDDIKTVPIRPGHWDIGNEMNSYKLKADAPKEVRTLARPSQVVLVRNLGYKVKLGGNLASVFDDKVSESNGDVRIFGVPVKIDGDKSESTESNSHVGRWDSATGELTVEPCSDAGFATVIAIIGEKIGTT